MRRLLGILGVGLAALIALWIGALALPDARTVMPSPSAAPIEDARYLAVPIAGIARTALRDNWGDPRDNGQRAHHGTDIVAPAMTPVHAAAPGTIEKLFESRAGGTTIYERSTARDWTYYYAHLAAYVPGLREGQPVRAGDVIGYVGDTGDAGAGNYHLHFGLTRTAPDQHWYQGTDVNPYPYLAGTQALR